MYFSRKIFPTALLILCAGCMPTHFRVSDSHAMDDARTRLILKTVPGFDMGQVWFATGAEYWNSPTCLSGRDIYAFTKPEISSPGIWRGKKAYVRQPVPISHANCADPDAFDYRGFDIDTVSFIDPDKFRPEEAWDGAIPGIFEVRGDITDDQLRKIAATMEQVRMCLRKQMTCDYPIDHDHLMHWTDGQLAAAMAPANLVTFGPGFDFKPDNPCYDMVFQTGNFGGAFGMGICYRDEKVTRVDVGGEVIE